MIRIRYGNRIGFDKDGVHATGREVYREILPGFWGWVDEYENDYDTVDLPVTEPDSTPEEDDQLDSFLAEWDEWVEWESWR